MSQAKYDPAEAFRQLRDPDADVRLSGAKWLHRHALAAVNRWSDEWLRSPDTVAALLPALADPDGRVAEEAVGAAAGVAERYRRDGRLLSPAVALLASDRPRTRLRAAVIVSLFRPGTAVRHLVPLFVDPDPAGRAGVMAATAQACPEWPAGPRRRVRAAALDALLDRSVEVRCQAASLLSDVGEAGDLPALEACLAGVRGANYRRDFREAVRALRDRRGS